MQKFIVMWTYEDRIGRNSGNVEIDAVSREEAEQIFYELNRRLILGKEAETLIYNPLGGYLCECVLTYEEWVNEGKPERLFDIEIWDPLGLL